MLEAPGRDLATGRLRPTDDPGNPYSIAPARRTQTTERFCYGLFPPDRSCAADYPVGHPPAEDDAFSIRVGLGDILQDNVIDIVASGDLFADLEQPAPYDRETQRRHELIEAWLAPCSGRAPQ
jgi:hypothetical protein